MQCYITLYNIDTKTYTKTNITMMIFENRSKVYITKEYAKLLYNVVDKYYNIERKVWLVEDDRIIVRIMKMRDNGKIEINKITHYTYEKNYSDNTNLLLKGGLEEPSWVNGYTDGKSIEIKFVSLEDEVNCTSIDTVPMISYYNYHLTLVSPLLSVSFDPDIKIANLNKWDVSRIKSLDDIFNRNSNIEKYILDDWDTSNCIFMSGVFEYNENLKEIDINSWNVSNVITTKDMFRCCKSLEKINLNNWNTRKLRKTSDMFSGCESLKEVNIDKWDVRNMYSTHRMFYGCLQLEYIYLNDWNTKSLSCCSYMFDECLSLKFVDISGWNTKKCKYLIHMFNKCISLKHLNLNSWDTHNFIEIDSMFKKCYKLKHLNISNWVLPNLKSARDVFCKNKNNYDNNAHILCYLNNENQENDDSFEYSF